VALSYFCNPDRASYEPTTHLDCVLDFFPRPPVGL